MEFGTLEVHLVASEEPNNAVHFLLIKMDGTCQVLVALDAFSIVDPRG